MTDIKTDAKTFRARIVVALEIGEVVGAVTSWKPLDASFGQDTVAVMFSLDGSRFQVQLQLRPRLPVADILLVDAVTAEHSCVGSAKCDSVSTRQTKISCQFSQPIHGSRHFSITHQRYAEAVLRRRNFRELLGDRDVSLSELHDEALLIFRHCQGRHDLKFAVGRVASMCQNLSGFELSEPRRLEIQQYGQVLERCRELQLDLKRALDCFSQPQIRSAMLLTKLKLTNEDVDSLLDLRVAERQTIRL